MSSEQDEDFIKTPQEVKYFIVESNENYKLARKNKSDNPDNSDIDENLKHQIIKFFIVKLNEEYKSYQKNMRFRQNLFVAEIFISLTSIFLGQLFALAEDSDIMTKIGTQLSSVFGVIGVLVTIVTAYLNNTAQKYFEAGSSTELDESTFKLMYLHIDDKVIKEFGGIWIGVIILSKSCDFIESLELRIYAKEVNQDDSLDNKKTNDEVKEAYVNDSLEHDDNDYVFPSRLKYDRKYMYDKRKSKEGMEGVTQNEPKEFKKPQKTFRLFHLQLFPLWVTNIELILNEIRPIIIDKYKDYKKQKYI
ncbi:12184_t:CDS:2, partial [Cetraspora pellucida]